MREAFGELMFPRDDTPAFGLIVGSALTHIAVFPWGKDDSIINARSYVVTGVELTPDLQRYLLEKNGEVLFGAFGVDKSGDIFFDHTIVGSSCDKNELKTSVIAVANTADKYDDEIISRWGGQRAVDRYGNESR